MGGTTIRFTWHHDRWAHEIAFADGSSWRSVEAAEADGDPRWPASPVLVELSRLDGPDGPALLAVGRAGRSHFSASVTGDPSRADALRIDVACRVHEPPGWLGSTYRSPGGILRIAAPGPPAHVPETVRWGYSLGPAGLVPPAESTKARLPPPAG
ncbi:MAG: hypothetical protein EBZ74_09115 [Planctomycetia bacterium]|nr:hypothetical protein [Planctomycetia bacterium]